jgi:syntaxin-binding protein 1
MQYLLYRDGLLPSDTQKLLAHAQLPAQDGEVIQNLDHLGAHVSRSLKDTRPLAQPCFGRKQAPHNPGEEESGLSRFDPAIKPMLEDHIRGTLDQGMFPFTKPHLDAAEGLSGQDNVSQASLRSAKPTWARTRSSALEPKQRIIVFIAGGATYSESRASYEVSQQYNKDVFLVTSHMVTPSLYLRQLGDLSVDKRQLDLPAERPKPRAPAHLFERVPQRVPEPTPQLDRPVVASIGAMSINSTFPPNGTDAQQHSLPAPPNTVQSANSKLSKKDREKEPKGKKKHHFFGSKK